MRVRNYSLEDLNLLADTSLTNREIAKSIGKTEKVIGAIRRKQGIQDYPHGRRGSQIANRQYRRWNSSSVFCKTSGAACHICANHKFYGLHKDRGCHMPEAVKILEEKGVPIPKYALDKAALDYAKSPLDQTG